MAKKKQSSSRKPGNTTALQAGAGSASFPSAASIGVPMPEARPREGGKEPGKDSALKQKTGAVAQKIALSLPLEISKGDWTVLIMSLMVFFGPALGVPNEEMLQDTLKSIVVAMATLSAGLVLFWHQRNRRDDLRWHFVMWLPLLLCAYALGSMVWSHTYLAEVEAIRWFIFSLIVWLGLNTFSRERLPYLAWGLHWGAVVASLWTALQF